MLIKTYSVKTYYVFRWTIYTLQQWYTDLTMSSNTMYCYFCSHIRVWSPNSVNGTVATLRNGQRKDGHTAGRGTRFVSSPDTPDWLQDPSSLLFNGHCCFPKVNRSGRLADHLSLLRVEVKNEWSNNFMPTIRLRGGDRGILCFTCVFIVSCLFML